MKRKSYYVCEICGKQSEDREEIMTCEAAHYGLSIAEKQQWEKLKKECRVVSYAVNACCNEHTNQAYEEAIENCLQFEKEHHLNGPIKKEKSFVPGDVVYVSNPDKDYEEEYGSREHKSFFGTVIDVILHDSETYVEVNFPTVPNEYTVWCYSAKELSPAAELRNLTLEELENRFGVQVFAKYL